MVENLVTARDVVVAARKSGRELSGDISLDSGFQAEVDQARVLAIYIALLVKWNKSMNLVGPKKWQEIFSTLIVDSLYLADFLNDLDIPDEPLVLDLGAGAGLPGIPLRCVWQDGEYVLVESRQKRSIFMRTALNAMGLPRTSVFNGRAENLDENMLPADVIVSRAFMPWPELLDFVKPMLSSEGRIVVLSNDPAPSAKKLIEHGFELETSMHYDSGMKTHFFWSAMPVI
jgi:16S rRNA (guanine527-N7)-methyltransferase